MFVGFLGRLEFEICRNNKLEAAPAMETRFFCSWCVRQIIRVGVSAPKATPRTELVFLRS